MTYDSIGNLTLVGKIEINAEEFKGTFVEAFPESVTRDSIYEGFQAYQETLLNTVMSDTEQWIDGSWVSNKQNPGDIDLVNLVELQSFTPTEFVRNKLHTKYGSVRKYQVDAYVIIVCPEDDPRYDVLTKKTMEYWDKWWSHDRNDNEKGYIVLKTKYQGVKNV